MSQVQHFTKSTSTFELFQKSESTDCNTWPCTLTLLHDQPSICPYGYTLHTDTMHIGNNMVQIQNLNSDPHFHLFSISSSDSYQAPLSNATSYLPLVILNCD